jgi:hypothetical protein
MDAHLQGCPTCAQVLADLRAIVAAAPHYPGRAPERDLWKGIEARLDDPDVVSIGSRPASVPSPRRFGWPALIAASLATAVVGAGSVWLALKDSAPVSTPIATQPVPITPRATSTERWNAAFAETKYDAAVLDLEQLLAAGQSRLDTATVRSVEESLAKIDAAIAEARAAIQRDPANAYLNRQIAANMRRKLNLLRTATNAIAART